jgi:hypothetical protein
MPAKKLMARLSYRVAMARNCLSLQKKFSIPRGRPDRGYGKRLLIARRQPMGGNLGNVSSTRRSDMAKGLNDSASRAARCDQMLRRSVTEVNDALAQHDATERSIGQVDALGRNLGRQAESIGCKGSGNLHL